MTLLTRVTLISVSAGGALISVLLVVALFTCTAVIQSQRDDVLAEIARSTSAKVSAYDPLQLHRTTPAVVVDVHSSSAQWVDVIDRSGQSVYSTGVLAGAPPSIPRRALTAAPTATSVDVSGIPLRLNVLPVEHLGSSSGGWVVAAESTVSSDAAVRRLDGFLVLLSAAGLIVTACALWRLTRRALRPLAVAVVGVRAIGESHDPSLRLSDAPRQDEIGALVGAINGMLSDLEATHARLDRALTSQRAFSADASHELRTPLTSMRSNIDFLRDHPDAAVQDRDAALDDLDTETARMTRLVDDLLTLARADGGHHLTLAPIDVIPLVDRMVRRATRTYPERSITGTVGGTATVDGNEDAITQLGWILLSNAARHTGAGGQVAVTCAAEAGHVVITVTDDGDGIPPDELDRIFDRFHQVTSPRSGGSAGLGLAIARWIVSEHAGSIGAQNVRPHGARFTVTLPLSATSQPDITIGS